MKGKDRIQLISDIGRELQANFTYSDIDTYLPGFGVDVSKPTSSVNSKWVYVKDLLSDEDNETILKIANDLGIEHGYHSDLDVDPSDSPFWEPNHFRLFLSHLSSFKEKTEHLRRSLLSFGISSFVAHESIEPTRKWQDEIEKALHSMNALAAILTKGFNESCWTDQEIGVALGRRLLVIPIKKEIEPYGFISKYQAVDADGKKVKEIAQEIFSALARSDKTKYKLCDCLTNLLLTSSSRDDAERWISLLDSLTSIPTDHLKLIQEKADSFEIFRENQDVLEKINLLLQKYEFNKVEISDWKEVNEEEDF